MKNHKTKLKTGVGSAGEIIPFESARRKGVKKKKVKKTPAKKALPKVKVKKTPAKVKVKVRAADNGKSSSPKKKRKPLGRRPIYTPEEAGARRNTAQGKYQARVNAAGRDIYGNEWLELIAGIDWNRRLSTKHDLKRFLEIYLPNIFYLGWSTDQLRCVRKTETVFIGEAMFALAIPRAGGKTAIVRGGITWGVAHGHKRFPFNVGSTDPKSIQTLNAIKSFWYGSPKLLQDFPEIAWAINRTQNRFHLARGQTFQGQLTHIEWGSNSVRFPSLLLSQEDAEAFHGHDDTALVYLKTLDRFLPRQGGINVATAGIGGAMRGEAETHPITLEQPRPDVVILDDIQKDSAAESPMQVAKLVNLIDGAITGLAGPGRHISVLMPCTVTKEGDVSDQYLDTNKKPEYRGERCQLVSSWPDGITDTEISLDTEAGVLWNDYQVKRREAFQEFEKHSLRCEHCRNNLIDPCKTGRVIQLKATRHYKKNRKDMDKGFTVTWKDRYGNPTLQADGTFKRTDLGELSAQQHAMNLRLKAPLTFPAEYQNRGRKLNQAGDSLITAGQLACKIVDTAKEEVSVEAQHLAGFLDVQNEGFFWGMLAVDDSFTGTFTYGTWPQISTRYFTKNQMGGWSLLTREFFKAYPEQRDKATRTEAGKLRAPLEAKIYFGLSQVVPWLMGLKFAKQDQFQTVMTIDKMAIDTRWGQTSDTVKRYIRECGNANLIPYYGQAFPPTHRQLEEYTLTKGWHFEHQRHPNVKDPKWVVRPNPDGMYYMSSDVSRQKDFIMNRLSSPPGSIGSISLCKGTPEDHEMVADHICNSEYPEPVTARGMTKNLWKERDGSPDNDWLDCLVGCATVASMLGACLVTGGEGNLPQRSGRRKLSELAATKRGRGSK